MAEITMMATIPLMVHGNLDPDSCTNIGRVVVKRYPQLDEVAKLVDGPFRTLLHPDVHAALQASLTLLAVGEWIAQPDEDLDDMIRASGCSVLGFKRGLLHSLVNQARMTLNNSSSGFTSQLESMATGAENLSDRDSVSSFLEPLKGVWAMALDSPTAESAVSCEWLRRYLMVEIGRSYKAFSSVDLLFAIYKLFLAEDFSYGQEESLYQALVDKAGFRFFSPSGEDPYAWLKELAHLEKDEAAVVSSSTGTCQNDRSVTAFATSPSNFGIFSLGSKTPSGGPAAIPEIFGGEEYDNTLTHVLGFHLDSEAQSGFCLPGCSLSRVDKEQGGEIDSHLSLRGRRALSKFEDRLHAAIKEQLAQPWEDNCGLFVVVRYGTMSCLTRCLVVRTSCAGAGSSGGWTAEYVTAFGSEPQKGSSWGIAKSLECLVDDLCVLPGVVGASYMSFGTVEAIAENFPLSNGFLSDPHDEEWFSGFPLALTAGAEPTRAPIPEGGVESSGKGLGDLPGDSGDSKLSHDHSGFSVGRVEVPLPAVPAGKTTFGGHEIDLVGEIHACMAKSGFDSESLMAYYKVLERNYVHDSVMAGHLGYFAQLCDVFATQLSDGAAQQAVLNQPMLKQRFDYFVEDFGDAISDSDDCEEAKTLARGALDRLQAILDGAQ